MIETSIRDAAGRDPVALRAYRALGYWNNLLLIPMFTVMALETSTGGAKTGIDYVHANLFFCASFLIEYAVGFVAAERKWVYFRNPQSLTDLVSSIPFGYFFQGLRTLRLVRIVRIMRVVWRAKRFKGKGARLIRALGLVGSLAFAGALALRIVEPTAAKDFGEAIWWAIVTLSTVGYGDITPVTDAGRIVAICLMLTGVGLFGFLAGFVASVMEDPDEDEILATVKRIEARLQAIEK